MKTAKSRCFSSRRIAMGSLLLALLQVAPTTLAEDYRRASLDERVRASDLIIVGTVTAINENKAHYPIPPAAMATKIATLTIEQTLKGSHESRTVDVGFDLTSSDGKHQHEKLFEANKKYVVFLRSLNRSIVKMHGERQSIPGESVSETLSFKSPVNWRHGIYLIEDEKVWDPRYPSEIVNLHRNHNIRAIQKGEVCSELAPIPPASDYDRKIPLQEALSAIRAAVVATNEVIELGRVLINETPCPILIRNTVTAAQVVIRHPKRADCTEFDVSRIEVTLARDGKSETKRLNGPMVWPTETHVDPTGTFQELTWDCPNSVSQERGFVLRVLVDGKLPRLFESNHSLRDYRPQASESRCAVCSSFDVSRISYGYWMPPMSPLPEDVRCSHPPLLIYDRPSGCIQLPEDYHCNMCGVEWGSGRAEIFMDYTP